MIERFHLSDGTSLKLKTLVYDAWCPCKPHQLSHGNKLRIYEDQLLVGQYVVEATPTKLENAYELLLTKEEHEHSVS